MRPEEHVKIVIIADLGCLRALRLNPLGNSLESHQGPVSIEEIHYESLERKSDRPSRFPLGRSEKESVSMTNGEPHEERNEFIKRQLKTLAQLIDSLLAKEPDGPWILAAPTAINRRLLALIDTERREFLIENLKSDLTHATLRDLEGRFLPHKQESKH